MKQELGDIYVGPKSYYILFRPEYKLQSLYLVIVYIGGETNPNTTCTNALPIHIYSIGICSNPYDIKSYLQMGPLWTSASQPTK